MTEESVGCRGNGTCWMQRSRDVLDGEVTGRVGCRGNVTCWMQRSRDVLDAEVT